MRIRDHSNSPHSIISCVGEVIPFRVLQLRLLLSAQTIKVNKLVDPGSSALQLLFLDRIRIWIIEHELSAIGKTTRSDSGDIVIQIR